MSAWSLTGNCVLTVWSADGSDRQSVKVSQVQNTENWFSSLEGEVTGGGGCDQGKDICAESKVKVSILFFFFFLLKIIPLRLFFVLFWKKSKWKSSRELPVYAMTVNPGENNQREAHREMKTVQTNGWSFIVSHLVTHAEALHAKINTAYSTQENKALGFRSFGFRYSSQQQDDPEPRAKLFHSEQFNINCATSVMHRHGTGSYSAVEQCGKRNYI